MWPDGQQPWPAELDMLEAEDLTQLRLLNLQLLRQLWAGQDAVRRSVARATLAVGALPENWGWEVRKGLPNTAGSSHTPRITWSMLPIWLRMGKLWPGTGLASELSLGLHGWALAGWVGGPW